MRFLADSEIGSTIEGLFKNAEMVIIIISPFIKLSQRMKDILAKKAEDPKIGLRVLYGKNEERKEKSLSNEDLEFFKTFKDVEIAYNPRLHGKFYSNEFDAVATSMNLYDFSINNNIEFGLFIEGTRRNNRLNSQIFEYVDGLFKASETLFDKHSKFNNGILGLNKKYLDSEIAIDKTVTQTSVSSKPSRPEKLNQKAKKHYGYCIRTGQEVEFNLQKPMSYEAYRKWNQFSNPDYKEKFCHLTGEPSNGETSMRYPILKRNYRKAQSLGLLE